LYREPWHTSLVNAVSTDLGGTHVDHVVGQLVKYVVAACAAKKPAVNATPAMVKRAMHVFVNCQIENPTFESQTKRQLTLPAKEFGSKCELTPAQLKTLLDKTGVVAHVIELASAKEFKDVAKALTTSATSAASRSKRLIGVPKLDDANEAGGKQSAKCTLILTEGDSAKALAVAGLSVVGRDHYGVFPLRGKLLNVREATAEQLKKNAEIGYLVQILGLRFDVDYADSANFKTLRYGRVCIMSDQDLDGSHIRGLIINFFGHFWPSLLKRNDFLSFFVTPIRSFSKGGKTRYCLTAEESLRVGSGECAGWAVKYYKGLGSSTAAEAKMYFKDMARFIVTLQFTGDGDLDAILLAFAKARANDRKTWLAAYDSSKAPDYSTGRMTYRQFVDTELVHFSAADNVRSIPSVVDGLKPAHRQVLWTFLKRNLTSDDNKVAAVAGQIITDAAYHHGEASLHGTIVGMAQDYMGSGNNINLLVPNGQFGTRHQQGKDAASARYIFTGLSPLARLVFPPEDDAVLTYVESDGETVQPLCYVPVIPMVLVNGTEGIGTGWSTSVPPHNPLALIDVLERWLQSGGTNTFDLSFHDAPWYRGFKGTVVEAGAAKWQQQADAVVEVPGKEKYIASGCRTTTDVDADTELHDITELPPGMATQAFRETLEAHFAPDKVVDFKEMHTDTDVHFAVTVNKQWAEAGKVLTLERPVSLTNMVLFRPDGQHLSKFDDRTDILRQFAQVRLDTYGARKHHQMATMARDLAVQERKATFIVYVKAGKVDLQQARATVEATLTTLGLAADWDAGFNDLLDMPLSSLTLEKVTALKTKCDKLRNQLQELSGKSEADLWLHDLAQLRAALQPPAVVESKSKRAKLA
jgi:DNA topoisomerase-2